MSKKDYTIIAAAIKQAKESGVTNGAMLDKVLKKVINCFCTELKTDNPKFNIDKFFEACGYSAE